MSKSKSKHNTLSDFVDSLWSTPLCYYSYLSSLFLDQIIEFRNNSSVDLIKVSLTVIFLNRSLLQAHIDIELIAKQHRNGGKHGGCKGCHHHLILEIAVIVQQVCHVHHVHPRLASLCWRLLLWGQSEQIHSQTQSQIQRCFTKKVLLITKTPDITTTTTRYLSQECSESGSKVRTKATANKYGSLHMMVWFYTP